MKKEKKPSKISIGTVEPMRDNIKVDNFEVSAIVVSRIESQIKAERIKLENERENISKMIKEDSKTIKDIFKKEIEESYEDILKAVRKVIRGNTECDGNSSYKPVFDDHGILEIGFDGNFAIRAFGHYVQKGSCVRSPEVLAMYAKDKEHHDRICKINEELCNLNNRIFDLPSVERRFRASLAESYLSSLECGQDVLKQVDEFVRRINEEELKSSETKLIS